MDITDPAIDDRIRAALKSAHAKDKLPVVAAVTGIDVPRLREIMHCDDELPLMDRGTLACHLDGDGG